MKIYQINIWALCLLLFAWSPAIADTDADYSAMDSTQLKIEAKSSAIAKRILARRLLGLDDNGQNVSQIVENDQMQTAIDLLRAASSADAIAANTLGTLVQNGVAKPKYEGEDRDLFKFASDRGNEGGKVNLAISKLFSGNPIEASSGRDVLVSLIQNSSSDWSFVALRGLSTAMLYGIGGERDIGKAIEGYELFLQFSPEDAGALTILGQAKQYGWVGEPDLPAAMSYYERAVKSGSSSAMWQLAMIYQNENGTKKDLEKAWDLVVRSSDAGFENAMISRAVMLALGQGIAQDYKQSFIWYEKVAKRGRAHAIRALAYMYQQGQATKPNPQIAWGLYELAAPFDEIAQTRLDEMKLAIDDLPNNEKNIFLQEASQQAQNWLDQHNLSREDLR